MASFDIREPSIDALKSAPVYFRYGSNKKRILVDALTANSILAIYGACSADNQAKLGRMVSGSPAQLHRVAALAFKHTSIR